MYRALQRDPYRGDFALPSVNLSFRFSQQILRA
jgi:hypothetical protein